MAELDQKLPINAQGRFYVDSTCIDCDMCRQIAPDLFARDDENHMSYVARQPQDSIDEELANEAVDSCPSCSIGADGDIND